VEDSVDQPRLRKRQTLTREGGDVALFGILAVSPLPNAGTGDRLDASVREAAIIVEGNGSGVRLIPDIHSRRGSVLQ
jgi:hypothetical protein